MPDVSQCPVMGERVFSYLAFCSGCEILLTSDLLSFKNITTFFSHEQNEDWGAGNI